MAQDDWDDLEEARAQALAAERETYVPEDDDDVLSPAPLRPLPARHRYPEWMVEEYEADEAPWGGDAA